jgi:hypothetical protein
MNEITFDVMDDKYQTLANNLCLEDTLAFIRVHLNQVLDRCDGYSMQYHICVRDESAINSTKERINTK